VKTTLLVKMKLGRVEGFFYSILLLTLNGSTESALGRVSSGLKLRVKSLATLTLLYIK